MSFNKIKFKAIIALLDSAPIALAVIGDAVDAYEEGLTIDNFHVLVHYDHAQNAIQHFRDKGFKLNTEATIADLENFQDHFACSYEVTKGDLKVSIVAIRVDKYQLGIGDQVYHNFKWVATDSRKSLYYNGVVEKFIPLQDD